MGALVEGLRKHIPRFLVPPLQERRSLLQLKEAYVESSRRKAHLPLWPSRRGPWDLLWKEGKRRHRWAGGHLLCLPLRALTSEHKHCFLTYLCFLATSGDSLIWSECFLEKQSVGLCSVDVLFGILHFWWPSSRSAGALNSSISFPFWDVCFVLWGA